MSTAEIDITDSPADRRWRWFDFAMLVALMAIAAAMRVWFTDPVPSYDELWHMATTNGLGSPLSYYAYDVVHRDAMRQVSLDGAKPIWAIWTDMRGVLHPPLFLMALRLWRDVFGETVRAAHAFSISWSVVGLGFLFATARLTMNRVIAVMLALAVAVSQTQIYLAQEIRPYGMLLCLGAISVWLMTRVDVLGPTRRRAVLLGFMTLLLVMTHYFGFGGALAIGLFGVVRLRGHRRAFLTTVGAAAVFFIVTWVPIALRQTKDFAVGDTMLKWKYSLTYELLMAAGTPFRLIAERDYQIEFTPVFSGVLFVLPWLLIRRFRPLFPWVLWLCCTIGCLLILDAARSTRHVAYVRYLAIASPAVPLLFAGVVWPMRRWLAYLASATLILTGFIYLISKNAIVLDAQDYDSLVRVIAPRIKPGEPIIVSDVSPKTSWRAPVWIMTLSNEPGLFPRTMAMLTRPMTPSMIDELGSHTMWLICAEDSPPADVLIPGGRAVEHYYAWENIQIYRVEIGSLGTAPTTAVTGEGAATRPSR